MASSKTKKGLGHFSDEKGGENILKQQPLSNLLVGKVVTRAHPPPSKT
jgi:hypothetical protein